MKLSLHLVLWTADPNTKGLLPIYVRVTINRQTAYLATGEFVSLKQWNDKDERVKNHPLEVDINARLGNQVAAISRKFTEITLAGKMISAKELKAMFQGGKDLNNMFDFVDAFIEEVRHKRSISTLENYRKAVTKVEEFHGSRNLSFEEMTPEWLQRYESYLRNIGHIRVREKKGSGLGNNYIHQLFKVLKTIFNAAIKKGITEDYPFERYENPIYKAPVKDYLTLEEIKKVEKLADQTKDPFLRQAAVYFILGIATGLRISDWLKFSITDNIINDRVILHAAKNGEPVSMPVNAILKRNIRRMTSQPLSAVEKTINLRLKDVAVKAGIKKHLTTHTGRHTFAITLCADRGVSSETCAELMGITVNTCVENYYRVTNRKIDTETLKAWQGL